MNIGCVSGPDLVSLLYVGMCPDTQTQNHNGFYLHHKTPAICNLTRESCVVSLQSHTSHSSWHHFTHVKDRITHVLNVEWRSPPYGPYPHTDQHVKVSTLCKTHSSIFKVSTLCKARSSIFSKQIVSYQVRMFVRSGYGVVAVCGRVQSHRHKSVTDSTFITKHLQSVI